MRQCRIGQLSMLGVSVVFVQVCQCFCFRVRAVGAVWRCFRYLMARVVTVCVEIEYVCLFIQRIQRCSTLQRRVISERVADVCISCFDVRT